MASNRSVEAPDPRQTSFSSPDAIQPACLVRLFPDRRAMPNVARRLFDRIRTAIYFYALGLKIQALDTLRIQHQIQDIDLKISVFCLRRHIDA